MMIGLRVTSEMAVHQVHAPGKAVRKKGNIGLQHKEELLDSLGTCLRENANTALCHKARDP